jgi:peptidoglycan/xylan/chitin deacetylase (PgdA/CDA1 family)
LASNKWINTDIHYINSCISVKSRENTIMIEKNQKGIFIISLDFELHWGIRDKKTIESYKENLLGVRSVVPSLLHLFSEYQIHATWATVGFLFFETKDDLVRELPDKKPNYTNRKLNPYNNMADIGINEREDPFHFASSLTKLISAFPYQEIGSHTFSHYYCLEDGQNVDMFRDDIESAIKIAKKNNLTIESLVFPRNQLNRQYLAVCEEMGIKAYRGNQSSWIYKAKSEENESLFIRGVRLIDTYVNIYGHNCYSIDNPSC